MTRTEYIVDEQIYRHVRGRCVVGDDTKGTQIVNRKDNKGESTNGTGKCMTHELSLEKADVSF